ncbi:hypothetical protein MRB53_006469 [Persea americana]|uniref:Uncharacterized protein n=1 Tax=Persea americana TaxID=3435 RepID=A0ACC2MH70_PERAE|nr:hypothetical protein MRB53_006469 [Persea americana]
MERICDNELIDKAREYLGLSELEKSNQDGGVLCVNVGDALLLHNQPSLVRAQAVLLDRLKAQRMVVPSLRAVFAIGRQHNYPQNRRGLSTIL